VNNALPGVFGIFNPDCLLIAQLENIAVRHVYCDRGLCDDGNVTILTDTLNVVVCS
jgi:hypothetical protein